MKAIAPLLLVALVLPIPAQSQEATVSAGSVAEELVRLNATVARSNELLQRLVRQQEATLLVRRLELAAARADAAEGELRRLQAERSALEQRRQMFAAMLEQHEEALDDAAPELRAQLEREQASLELELTSSDGELSRLEAALIATETELRSRRDRLIELQEVLDETVEDLLRGR